MRESVTFQRGFRCLIRMTYHARGVPINEEEEEKIYT
jgi:hypothetical protein